MNNKVRYMVFSGIFSALMALCAWISIPLPQGSFTLQLFAVAAGLAVLGGKWGCISILTYLLLGAFGLPVFSGFRGGAGALLGPTGGFLLGFLAMGLGFWMLDRLLRGKYRLLSLGIGLALCYGFGCWWYQRLYGVSWQAAVIGCVLPYLIPDLIKLILALSLSRRLEQRLKI